MAHKAPSCDWRSAIEHLPIAKHLDRLSVAINESSLLIIEAPPGSGKTTVLPLHLLEQEWLATGSVVMLQPRRIAAKTVATRMAELLGEHVGQTIGYQVRLETCRSSQTRVEVITEGLLTKRLIADPALEGVKVLILDEFHERGIHADVALALALESAALLRPDLKIVVMSATLGDSLANSALKDGRRFTFEGTPFPVTISYEPGETGTPVWQKTATAIRNATEKREGDILAFLPGVFEIERTAELLDAKSLVILPLFGDLPYGEQKKALSPDPQGRRKVVLATPIAETSITIDGVRVVIDSGLHKVATTDSNGTTELITEPISRDAADQRAGRAGRTAPGVAIRLWSEHEHLTRRPCRTPEIQRNDCASAILDIAALGHTKPDEFPWITPPPEASLAIARSTLLSLSAITNAGAITEVGRSLSRLGTHPRLGVMALEARRYGIEHLAGALLALLEDRDILRGREATSDITHRIDIVLDTKKRPDLSRVRELAGRWRERVEKLPASATTAGVPKLPPGSEVGFLLASAFPDRIAKRRDASARRYLLASGQGAALKHNDQLAKEEFIVIAALRAGDDDLNIDLAAPFNPELLSSTLSHLVTTEAKVEFDQEKGELLASTITACGAIVLREARSKALSEEERIQALANWLSTPDGFARLPWGEASSLLRARLAWARATYPSADLPNFSDDALRETVDQWLTPLLPAKASLGSLSPSLLHSALEGQLSWTAKAALNDLAPMSLTLPSGKARTLTYSAADAPTLEVKIQELFGVQETPTIGPARVPIRIHLMSPAHRPMQVTRDLRSFWKNSYPEIRKELRGRYPKHKWPEDPLKP